MPSLPAICPVWSAPPSGARRPVCKPFPKTRRDRLAHQTRPGLEDRMTRLPIEDALPALLAHLCDVGRAVLQAPPGAGKTTRVPLAMLEAGLTEGRIVMLEPRRLATRASAERMADTLGQQVGGTVGYAMRGAQKRGPDTRIEVITEGLLTRRLQDDPELTGIGALIFDEFHERALQADLGLALAWEARAALRPDLIVLVMSATLDAGPVARLLDDAPVVTAEGRSFPVQTRWSDAPRPAPRDVPQAAADLTLRALAEAEGGVLVFLPGEGEIRRTASLLTPRVPPDVRLRPLYGAMTPEAQRQAIEPEREGRKLVLATAIAETSLTIEDVRVVVDAGLARRAAFDPGSGMARLVTERVTRAEADQRAGRAGRVAPGVAYRLWTKGEEGALAAYPPPEIARADLAGLALDLAQWGASEGELAFLTHPPPAQMAEARALLTAPGALDAGGLITPHGRALAALPTPPRLAHMLAVAGRRAAPLAALLSDRDPMRGAGADLATRLDALAGRRAAEADRAAIARIGQEAKRLGRLAPRDPEPMSPGAQLALAYPDRIALRRPGDDPRYLMSGGKGARLDPADPLAGQRLLAVADLDGDRTEAKIRLAAPLAESELRALYGDRIGTVRTCHWSARDRRVRARIEERFGALVLSSRTWPDAPADATARAALEGVRALGLGALKPGEAFRLLRARLA